MAAVMGALALPLTMPARQRFHVGGVVKTGTPHLVGETGPETFAPFIPGYVLTADDFNQQVRDAYEDRWQ